MFNSTICSIIFMIPQMKNNAIDYLPAKFTYALVFVEYFA